MILKAKEQREKTYILSNMDLDYVKCSPSGNNIITKENREISARCLNCMKPSCINIKKEDTECLSFNQMASSVDMHLCPKDAITVSSDSVEIDSNKCIGCGLCATACPIGAINMVDGKAVVAKVEDSKDYCLIQVNEDALKKQQVIVELNLPKQGMLLSEREDSVEALFNSIKELDQEKQNLLVRNVLIALGNKATVSRKGNVYMRLDGYYENDVQHGVLEVETGTDMLDVSRAILDDMAVLSARYGIALTDNKPIGIVLKLQNKRTDYWQVVKDISNVHGIRIQTISIIALLILVWNNKQLCGEINSFYSETEDYSIRKEFERILGRKISLSEGFLGILEPEK